jgi:hypothetical protein
MNAVAAWLACAFWTVVALVDDIKDGNRLGVVLCFVGLAAALTLAAMSWPEPRVTEYEGRHRRG